MAMTESPVVKPLSLSNEGELEIVFIGTGNAFAQRLFQTNFLLIKGDTHVLVDFGMTGPQALREVAGLDCTDIRTILPTHSHADHIGGVEYLTLINRYVAVAALGRAKLNMIIHDEYRPVLWEMSLRGGLEFNEESHDGQRLDFADLYNEHPLEVLSNGPRRILRTNYGGINIELFHTNHIPGEATTPADAFITYGLMVDDRVFISGDTKFDRDLIDLYADRAEVMFHDAAFTYNPVHASTPELRTLPEHIRKKMYLMHYPDSFESHDVSDFAGYAQQGVRYRFP